MMRIGYLVPEFPGQTHAFFWREIDNLKKLGVQPRLISTRRPPKKLKSHSWTRQAERETIYLGDPRQFAAGAINLLPYLRSLSIAPKDAALFICAARLIRIAVRERLTHVHAHSCGKSALIAAFAHRLAGLHYSLSLHGPLDDYGDRQKEKFKDADFALAITNDLANSIRQRLDVDAPLKIGICPMGVDTEKFQRSIPFSPWSGGELRLFSCGRLNYIKGHQELIHATALLRQRGLDVKLSIAGEDDAGGSGYRTELVSLIGYLGLTDVVTLLGAVSEECILQNLQHSHLFVLASHHEPLGVAIMEALSYGIPVISTNAGGVPELIEHSRSGYLVAPKDPVALAGAIEYLIANHDAQIAFAEAGRKKMLESFDSRVGAAVLTNLLEASHGAYPYD